MEGLGTAVIEAMAAHLPVVAFDIPPVREITDDGRVATLVPVGDTAGMVDAIERLLDSEQQRREMAREARQWVEHQFTIEQVTERLRVALHRVAGEPGRRRHS
jgi:glycosyltransferase involved in cell wall biosynthesis